MGVKTCSRMDCDNIMCDTYIPGIGYICNECQLEFSRTVVVDNMSDNEYIELLIEFLKTKKEEYIRRYRSVFEFFSSHTY